MRRPALRWGPLVFGLVGLMAAAARAEDGAAPPAAPGAKSDAGAGISEQRLKAHVAFLSGPDLDGRGDPEHRKRAADYVAKEFKAAGVVSFPSDGADAQDYRLPFRRKEGREPGVNVVGWIPGTHRTEYVIVSAHYDHLGRRGDAWYPGADDNASGVAALIEVARALAAGPKPKRSVMCVAFDLEEANLVGSTAFTEAPPLPLDRCAAFTTADMLGRSLADLYPGLLLVFGSERATALQATLDALDVPKGSEIRRLGSDFNSLGWSDYVPFEKRKIPCLFFTSGACADYHTPKDMPDKIDVPHLAANARMWLAAVRALADGTERPAWIETPPPRVEEAKDVLSLVTRAEAKAGDLGLSDAQKALLVNYRKMLEGFVGRGAVTLGERAAIRIGALALLQAAQQAAAGR